MTPYKTIVADFPWSYRNKNTGGSMKSGSAAKYPTMTKEQIITFPMDELSDPKGSVLFLWATAPLLDEALFHMGIWEFKYKGFVVWHKTGRLGMGFWFRGAAELCLFGVRGKVRAFHCQKPNVIVTTRGKHSEKPKEFWELVESHCTSPRIELFCRGDPRPGWDGWGKDCTNPITLVPRGESPCEGPWYGSQHDNTH